MMGSSLVSNRYEIENLSDIGTCSCLCCLCYPVIELAAPTRVSPAPATEQKQHQKNNQYGFHVVPHL
jgi:hypothetical protein